MGGSGEGRGWQGVRTLPFRPKVPFLQKSAIFNVCPPVARNTSKCPSACIWQVFSLVLSDQDVQIRPSFIAQNLNFSQKSHSFIAQNQKFSPEKKPAFFATRKNVESYSQMPGKRISLIMLSFYSIYRQIHIYSDWAPGMSLIHAQSSVRFHSSGTPRHAFRRQEETGGRWN
jgi:hypothetical protein